MHYQLPLILKELVFNNSLSEFPSFSATNREAPITKASRFFLPCFYTNFTQNEK